MSDNVIQQFLVAVGVKIDEDGLRKFEAGLATAAEGAVALAAAASAAAVAVGAAVTKIGADLDKLYYQTQRLGSSATDIKAYGYAMEQMGGSARGAQNALEGIAEFAKSSPGAGKWLMAIGVSAKDLGNAQAMAKDLAQTFQHMPYYRAKAYAGMLGIDPIQLQAMMRPGEGDYEKWYRGTARRIGGLFGVNLDQSTKEGKDFMNNLRELRAEFELLFTAMSGKALEYIVPKLEQLAHWVEDMISGKKLGGMSDKFSAILKDVWELAKALGEFQSSPAIQKFGEAMADAVDHAIKAITHLVLLVNDVLSGDWAKARSDAAAVMGESVTAVGATGAAAGGVAVGVIGGTAAHSVNVSDGEKQRAQQAYSYFRSQGMTDVQAQGVAAMLFSESRLNPNIVNPKSGARGIAQWLSEDRLDEFRRVYHHGLAQSTYAEQLQFVVHELRNRYRKVWDWMAKQPGASGVAGIGISKYESPGFFGEMGDSWRAMGFLASNPFQATLGAHGAGAPTLNQTTNINVHGSGDPHQTARATADAQDSVNQRLAGSFAVTVK